VVLRNLVGRYLMVVCPALSLEMKNKKEKEKRKYSTSAAT